MSFNLYMNVNYPRPVVEMLMMFTIFDGGSLPSIVPSNKYYMPATKGFRNREIDAFVFRNAS